MANNDDGGKKKIFSFFVVGLLIVEEKKRVVVERFGEFHRILKSGLRCIFFPGILDRIKDEIFIEQETIPLFPEPIKIDFKDGSAIPRNAKAYIEIDRPDTEYLTKEEEKLTDEEKEKKGVEKRAGVFRVTYHIKNRKEAIRDRLENAVRSYLNGFTIQQGIEMARGGYDLLGPNGISKKETGRLKGVFEDWGTILHAITIGDFDLESDLVKARGELHKREKEKEAAEFVVKRQVKEWIGMILETMALIRGKSAKEIQTEIDAKEELQREFLDYVKMLKLRLEEANRNALVHVVVDGEVDKGEGKGNGFLDKFAKMAIKILAAKEGMSLKGKEKEDKKPSELEKEETEEEKGKRRTVKERVERLREKYGRSKK